MDSGVCMEYVTHNIADDDDEAGGGAANVSDHVVIVGAVSYSFVGDGRLSIGGVW